jgi:hypothetical protein
MGHLRVVLVAAVLLPTYAVADTFYDRILAEPGGVVRCYARIYEDAHMRSHPRQRVTHFFLRHSEAQDLTPPETFDIVIGYRLKESVDVFVTEAGCAAEGDGAICDAEGDAGSLKLAGDGQEVTVTIDDRLHLEGRVSFSPDLARDGDDSPLLLRPSPTADCHFE